MNKYIYLLLFFILFCRCSQIQKSNDMIRVSVLRGPSAIAFAEWMDHSPVIDGKTIFVKIVDSPDLMQASIIKEETDIAVLPMTNAANLYNKNIHYPLLGCPVWGTLYIVQKDSCKELYLFGGGTTPDILTQHYLSSHGMQDYSLNYTFGTPSEVMQGLMAGKVKAAVLSEPFVSVALKRDSALRIVADLNTAGNQTAVVYNPNLHLNTAVLDSLLQASCLFATTYPEEAIRILEEKEVFAPGMLSPETVERCKIHYKTARAAREEVFSFLKLIRQYAPKAIGGKLPDTGFISEMP